MDFLKILRTPHLAILWGGQMLSAIGDQCSSVALLWMTTRLLGSTAGVVSALGWLAALLFSLPSGALVDRWSRRETMVYTDLGRALLAGMLAFLAVTGMLQVWQLILLSISLEALGTLFDPALVASLPLLTRDSKQLYAANTLMDGTQRMARILGPGLTGLLLLLFPLTHFFTLDAISFILSALSTLVIARYFPARSMQTSGQERKARGHIFSDMRTGLVQLCAHRPLAWGLGCLGLSNISWGAVLLIGVPLLVGRMSGANAGTYGLIMGAYGVGNVLSLFLTNALSGTRDLRWMYAGQLVLGLGFLLIGVATTPILAMVGAAIAAIGSPVGDLILVSIIQTDFPSTDVGKMYSMRRFIAGLGLILGSVLATPLFASHLYIASGIVLCSCFILLIASISLAHEWLARQ